MNISSFPRLGETAGGTTSEKVIVLERDEEGKNLHGVSPFLIEKVISGYCSNVANIKKTKEGKIFVTVKNESQATNLAKIKEFAAGIPVKVYEHQTLNFCKVVIFCRDIKNESDASLTTALANQGIVETKQIIKRRDGDETPTGIFVLTVKGMTPPKKLKIGYMVLETRPWYPNPLRCFVCLNFGHIGKSCKSEKKCGKCGDIYHEECNNEEKCLNCGNAHTAFFNGCPAMIKEKAIIKIKVDNNISFWEARKMYETTNKTTYTEALKTNKQFDEKVKQLAEEKKTYAEALKTDLEKQFEEKLAKYKQELDNIILESERKIKLLEEKYQTIKTKCDELVQSYQNERTRRKTAEKEANNLKQLNSKLQATLSLYAPKSAAKHTRSQDNALASPPRKKGNKMMAVTDEVNYIQSDMESEQDEEN